MTDILEAIEKVVGKNGVLTGNDVSNRPDGWGRPDPCKALAIVRPASSDEVSRVMRLCHDAGQKFR